MEYRNCEEYILSEYLSSKAQLEQLLPEYQKLCNEFQNIKDILVFLQGILKATVTADGKFDLVLNDVVMSDTQEGSICRNTLLSVFGQQLNQAALPESDAETKTEGAPVSEEAVTEDIK